MDAKRESNISNGEEGDSKGNAAPPSIRCPTSRLHEAFTSDIMVINECLKLSDLPQWGGSLQQCYNKVKMPAKLYTGKENIQQFTDEHLCNPYQVDATWHKWVMASNVVEFIGKRYAVQMIEPELRPQGKSGPNQVASINITTATNIFDTFDGKKKKEKDILSDDDRTCIHLLVNTGDFSALTHLDLIPYVREARCLENTLALINKYNKNKEVDTGLIRSHWPARPNRRFAEILIFISQFFGRADRLFPQEVVSKLWRALLFVNDFVLALLYQAEISRDKSSLKTPAGGVDESSIDASYVEGHEAVDVKVVKKRKDASKKDPNTGTNKKSRSENTVLGEDSIVLEEDQYDVSTNHFALFHPF
jgi:hypothetical protein